MGQIHFPVFRCATAAAFLIRIVVVRISRLLLHSASQRPTPPITSHRFLSHSHHYGIFPIRIDDIGHYCYTWCLLNTIDQFNSIQHWTLFAKISRRSELFDGQVEQLMWFQWIGKYLSLSTLLTQESSLTTTQLSDQRSNGGLYLVFGLCDVGRRGQVKITQVTSCFPH